MAVIFNKKSKTYGTSDLSDMYSVTTTMGRGAGGHMAYPDWEWLIYPPGRGFSAFDSGKTQMC